MPVDVQGYREFRAAMKAIWEPVNAPCGICRQNDIDWSGPRNAPDSFELDHIKSRKKHPELALDPGNAQPAHSRCNRAKQANESMVGIGVTSEAW